MIILDFFLVICFFLKYRTENQRNIEFMILDKISLQVALDLLIPLCKLVMGFLSSWWLWLSNGEAGWRNLRHSVVQQP